MASTKHILLFGAGKSATVLIDYLKETVLQKQWQLTIADGDALLLRAKAADAACINTRVIDIRQDAERRLLIQAADIVISLMPAALHYLVAADCILFKKHLLTASYMDGQIRALAGDIVSNGLLFLCEMGLDPGIDHMSAMQLIHRIRRQGGHISSFVSHCGGLVAPESDDNPWHYKISWNPKNIILAGKSGAVFKSGGKEIHVTYPALFDHCSRVHVGEPGEFAYYPNRDSLSYSSTYGLEDADTFMRTTLRHPAFCTAWMHIVTLRLTEEESRYNTDGLSVASFLQQHLSAHALQHTYETLMNDPLFKRQFYFLGWNDDTIINRGYCSAADVLQWLAEQKLLLRPGDHDMVIMLHELEYELDGKKNKTSSTLIVKGENSRHTAMAKTVGLPLGIAATLILEGKITMTGLHIPIEPPIYEPVLAELNRHGILFRETQSAIS